MDHYQQDMMAAGLLDMQFLSHQIAMGGMSYEMQDGSSMLSQPIKAESFETNYVGSFDGVRHQPDSRSSSCTSATSQSVSPVLQHPHTDLCALQVNNLPISARSEQISPSTTDLSKKESDDECLRTEVNLERSQDTTTDADKNPASPGTKPSCSKGVPTAERSQSQAKRA